MDKQLKLMRELTTNEACSIGGGLSLKLDLGQSVTAIAIAFVTGGPAVAGITACGIVMSHGINRLDNMYQEHRSSSQARQAFLMQNR